MALFADYTTLAVLKAYLHIGVGDTQDDAELALAITAASRCVDLATNRAFGVDGSVTARFYTWEGSREPTTVAYDCYGRQALDVRDISTLTGLLVKFDEDDDGVYERTLTINSDFQLGPRNAAADDRPWERIVLRPHVVFPPHLWAVEITAKFGWAAVPDVVEQATLIQATRFFRRRESPYGIAGSPDVGSELRLLARLDPDVAVMVRSVSREWFVN